MNLPVKTTGKAGGLDSGCQKSPAEAGLFRANYANEDKGARQLPKREKAEIVGPDSFVPQDHLLWKIGWEAAFHRLYKIVDHCTGMTTDGPA